MATHLIVHAELAHLCDDSRTWGRSRAPTPHSRDVTRKWGGPQGSGRQRPFVLAVSGMPCGRVRLSS